jgi:hypothetical protein
VPLQALSRTCNEALGLSNFWALHLSFLFSFSVLCHTIHLKPQMVIVCSTFCLKQVILLLRNFGTCLIIYNLQMGGIDETTLDKLSLVT